MKTDKKLVDKLFKQTFKSFDFEKAATCYKALGWEWFRLGGKDLIPKAQDLKDTVQKLHKDILIDIDSDPTLGFYSLATGGLEIVYHELIQRYEIRFMPVYSSMTKSELEIEGKINTCKSKKSSGKVR